MNSIWRQQLLQRRQVDEFICTWVGSEFKNLFNNSPVKRKRKRPGIVHSRRAKRKQDYDNINWIKLIRNPLTNNRSSYFGKLFRNRFRVPFTLFIKIRDLFVERNWLQTQSFDCFGRPSVPFEIKLLAALRFLGRGECFDTLAELTGDRVSAEVIRKFIIEWSFKMVQLKDQWIKGPNPNVPEEIQKAMNMYERLGFPGCIGSTDCVNIALERCPHTLKNTHTGKDGYPTLGFNCTVNHHRRFLNVARRCPGAWNDKSKVWFDEFVNKVRDDEDYKSVEFKIQGADGCWEIAKGVYLIVDGGYHRWRILQCPLKHSANMKECLHSKWLESVRKDVECAFGILKTRFRCLKLPSRFHNLQVVENIFVTCCILHNMLLDDELEQREEKLSGTFTEEEDLRHWIQNSSRYRADSVRFQFERVSRRSQAATDMSSTGDIGYDDDETEHETESGWSVLHKKLVNHFYRQWVTRKLEWTGCQQPIRQDRVVQLMRDRLQV